MVGAGPAGGLNDVVEQLENRSLLTYNTVSSMVSGTVVTFAGDATDDILTLTNDGLGNLQHNRFAVGDGGYVSAIDLDPNVAGVQSLAINAVTGLIIQAGDGNDTIQLGALGLTSLNNATGLQIDGGTGTADAIDIQGVVTIGNAGVGRLVITTAETLTQQVGATLTVQGTTSISGLTSSLVLNQANNFVGSVTINSSSDVTVNDTNAIDFAGISAANLTLSAGGAITDSGAGTIVATGATSLTAGANNITLDNANNNFGGTVSVVSGNDVALTDILGIDFGTSNITGALTVSLSGGGSVTDSGNLTVGGNTQINAVGLNVTLNSAGNNFAGIGVNGHTVAIVDSNGVDLRASVITDTYSVTTTAGNITNSGALIVNNGATATFTANGTNANITVNNALNTFTGPVLFVGPQLGSVTVLDITPLVLPTLNLTGNLTVTAQGITQGANTLTVAGTTNLTTTGVTDVTLPNGNDFTGAVTINSSQAATINDINGITFGNVTTATNAGSFNVTANGTISDGGAGVMTIGGTTSLTAGAGNNITLNQAGNDFGTAVALDTVTIVSGNNVTLRDMNAIDLGASTVSGNLSVTSSGNITDSGALNVTGTTTLAAGAANNITLDNANNFSTVSITSGLNVLLNDVNAIDLGASNVSGTLTITSAGNITDSGAVTVAGTTTLTPGALNNITLDNGNDFSTVVLVNGTNVTLNDTNAIALETTNPLSGTLTVTAGGAITDSNPITVVGIASFSAPGQNITLDNNNDFNTVSAVGATIVLTDSDNIVLGTVTASGNLTVNANGLIADSGIVTVGGTTSLTAGVANDITLDTAANNFTGAVSVTTANDVTLVDQNAIVLGAITTSVGGFLNVSAGADITQTAAVTVTGTTTLSTGAGSDITLTNAANDFTGAVTVTSANDVQIDDANAITFGNVTTSGGGNFTVDAGGAITFNGAVTVTGNADIESNANAPGSGTITDNAGAGVMVITGTTTFDAGGNNISFTNGANNFGGAVSVTDGIAGNDANDVTLVDANAITLGNIFAGGNLTVTVGAGDITATGALDIDGNTQLNGVAGANIIAGNAANSFTGSVNVTPNVGLNNLTLVDSEATGLILQSGLNITGNLTAQGQGLTQAAGGITVGGQSTLVSTGGIAMNLSDAANDFVGAVTVNTSGGGGGASIRDMNSIDFGGAPVLTSNVQGPLTVVANGAITDSGNMVVTGAASFTAGAANNITLDATTNDFQNGVSIVSGNNVTLTDANSIALGTSAIAGTLTITALNGAITDNGNVVVNGAGTTLTANGAANDITFNDAGTDLGGTVSVTNGRNVVLSDSVGGITLGAITATGVLQVTAAAGDINNTGALVVNGNSTFTANAAGANITVNNAGNTFVGSVTFAGAGGLNNVTVSDTTPLDLAGLTIGGNLTVTSTAQGVTSITDSGNLNVGLTTTLTADPTSNIVLNNNNQFGGAVSVASGLNVTLNETSANGIVLGASTVSGTYTVTSVKSISQNGTLNITGLPTFTVTDSPTAAPSSQDILLDTAANNFATTPVFTNNGIIQDLKLRNTNAAAAIPAIATVALNGIRDLSIVFNNTAIVLPALVFTRDLNVQAGGDITQSAALTVPRNATFTVPNANNITLTNAGNNFAAPGVGQVNVVSGNNVSLLDINTIGVGDIVAVGNVTINSTGTVDFVGNGASNIGGTLNVNNGATAGADILDNGAGSLTVVGTTTLTAGNGAGNDITLNNFGNDFGTVVITSAEDVTLRDNNGIDFGTSIVSATLTVNFAGNASGANVTQSGALTVTGAANFNSLEFTAVAGAQVSDVLLHTQANNFGVTPVFNEVNGNGRGIRDLKLRNTNAGAAVPVVTPANSLAGGFLRDVTLIYDNAAIDVPNTNINITGNLTLSAGGAITDTGTSTVGGTTTLTTGNFAIALDNAGNNFGGAVSATNTGAANNVTLVDANDIVLGTISTAGNLTVTATAPVGTGITQSNANLLDGATVGGNSTFNGNAGTITLNDPQNDFTGAVSLNNNGANNVSVTDANAIVLGASAVGTGTLTVNAVGITQAAAPNAIVQTAGAGAATFNGGAGVITLDDPNNDFTGNVSLNNTGANNVSITDVNAIQFGTSNVGSGTLTVNATGAITQAGGTSIIQTASAGAATFNAGANAITLNNATNDFTGAVSLNNNGNNNINLTDANTLILGASNFGTGNFNITAGGHITQTGALIEAAAPVGVATFTVTAANSDILLASAANNFTATPNFATAGAGTIRDLALRNVNAGNILASAALIPNAALLGGGTLRDLTLSFDNDPIDVPATNFSVTRNLTLTAAGTITNTGMIIAPGTTTLNSGANAILLNNPANNFGTVIANNNGANNVTLVDTDSIDLGASVIGGALLVTSGAGGGAGSHITESGILVVGTGGSTFTLGGANSDVLLGGFANNIVYPITVATMGGGSLRNFTLQNVAAGPAVINFPAAANDLTLNVVGAIQLGALNLAGNLNLTGTGDITQTGQWVVAGTSTFSPGAANNVTLNNPGNDFNTVLISDGNAGTTPDANNVSITDTDNINFGMSDIGGTLTVNAGTITDSGVVQVDGLATFAPGAGNSTIMDSAGNDFAQVRVNNGSNATFVDANSIILDNIALTNTLTVNVTGNITQNLGTMVVAPGTSTLSGGAAGNITLGNANNDFGTVSISDGNALTAPDANNVTLVDANTLNLGASNIGGTLNVTTNGALTDSGDVVVGGITTITAGAANDVTLDAAGNDFQAAVNVLTADDIILNDVNGILLNQITPIAAGGSLAVTAGGNITDTVGASMNVNGNASFNAGANNITLGNDAGDVQNFGSLDATGNVVSISEDSNVDLNQMSATTLTLTSETGAIIDNNAGANNFVGPNGATVALTAANGIGSGNALEGQIANLGLAFRNTTNGNVQFTNTGAMTVANLGGALATSNNLAVGGTVVLTANSPVTFAVNTFSAGDLTATANESAAVNTDNVTVNAGVTVQSGAGDILFQAGDRIITGNGANVLAVGIGGDVTFQSAFNDADGDGSMTLDGTISAHAGGGVVTLNAGTQQGVAQALTGTITGNGLRLLSTNESSGTFTLNSPTNDVNTIAAAAAGAISFRDTDDLTVGTVTTVGITTTGDNVSLTSGGALTIDDDVNVGAGNLTLNSAGNVTQNAGDDITAAGLELLGAGVVTLANAGNDVTILAAITGASITLNDADDIAFGTVNGTAGVATPGNLVITAGGDITDTANIAVTGNASFTNTAGSIELGDGAVNTNFGSLTLNTPNNATVTEDSATDIIGNNVIAGSLSLTSAGAVTDGVGTVVAVGAAATISGTSINLTDNVADNFGVTAAAVFTASGGGNITINALGTANFGTVTFNTTGNVTINEDSSTDLLNASTAANLVIASAGAITDQAGSSVTATGTASFSGTSITLLDNAGDILNVTGNANFAASGGGNITVSGAGTSNFGSITFNTAGNVTINEDSAMDISNAIANTAAILTLNSTGPITDQAGASVTTTGAANITGASLTLADNAADIWNIGGNANLAATSGGNITFNATGTVNFGSLTVNTTGNVTITEDSATDFNGNSTAAVLTVTSTGTITDNVGGAASIVTTGNANLTGANISLDDNAGDVLTVGGNANLTANVGGAITVAAPGTVNFNTLTFNTTGPVAITEDSQTDLTGVSTAGTLALTSVGAIADAATASTTVTGNAAFTGTTITLGDQAGDTFNVGSLTFNSVGTVSISENSATDLAGASTANSLVLISTGAITNQVAANIGVTTNASFNGTSITLGNQAGDTFNAGSLTLNSAGNVTVLEDSASDLAGANTAANFSLTSTGAITDTVGATLTTTGTASFSGASISLTDNGSDALAIAGAASFTATAGAITIAATGAANFLSVNFNATGAVTINEDSATDIAGANTGDSLVLTSAGAITDQANATIAITNNANFSGTTVTIGDQATDLFNAGTLTFNSAGTVSITEDSGMDLAAVSTAATLNLTSSGALTDQASLDLTVTGATTLAAQSIELLSTLNLNTLTANTVNGAISILETNGLTLTNVNSFNGTVTILSGGAINIVNVAANGAGSDVVIAAATGNVTVGTVTAADDVTLTAVLGSIVDDVNDATTDITGDAVTLTAANGIGASATGSIDTNAISLDASVTATGNLVINEANGITLTDVDTNDGSITVTAAGSIIATDVASLTDLEINDITITATAGGTITAGNINAGTIGGDVTVTAAGAVFDDGDPATDITADTLVITAGGAIGSAVNDLDLAVNTLTTNSAGNPQFLNELNTLAVGAADLNAGASTIRLGGGTFQTTAAGNIITSALTVGDGAGATATLAGDGTVTGTVSVAADGIVSPGFSTAILNTASVSFVAGSIFNVEVNGSTAGTLYDQLNVTGTVSLGGATLMTSGTITSSPGQVIVLINNDGVDAVSGAFAGLAEGSVVAIGGANFFISYAGGVGGNDVTLTEAGGTVTLSDNDGAADTWEVRRVGANIQVLNGATIVDSRPFAAGTAINILGEDGQHDTLLVNFTGGDPVPAGDISFTGGSGGGMDRVRLLGNGVSTTANYAPSATVANAGTVTFDSSNVLNFVGLEPLDIHAMAAVSLTGSTGVDALTVNLSTDFTLGGANSALRVSGTVNGGTTIETLAVWNSGSLTINGDAGNDTVTITNGANTHGINTITLNGGDDNDSFVINGVISASGSVNFNGDAGNDTFTFAIAGQILAGPIDGGTGSDTIVGDNDGNAFTVTALNAGTLTGKTTGFTNVENLTGGTGTDTFTLNGGTLSGAINGAGGVDTLNLDAVANVVTLTTVNGGTATGLSGGFTNVENINGNNLVDSFALVGGRSTGTISGGSSADLFTLDNLNNDIFVFTANSGTLQTATYQQFFTSFENITGNAQIDNLVLQPGGTLSGVFNGAGGTDEAFLAAGVSNTVVVTGVNAGTATGIDGGFVNVENIAGGSLSDSFSLDGGTLDGFVDGFGGNDTLNLDNVNNTVVVISSFSGTATGLGTFFFNIENINGNAGVDTFTLSGGSITGILNGAGNNDSLTLNNSNNLVTVNVANGGTATGTGGFANIENLNGGTANDTFTFTNAGSIDGNLNGGVGAGNDTIVGDDDGNVFTVNAINGGTLAVKIGGTFADVENLIGGDEGDTFIFTNAGSLVGDVNGGDGSDTLVGDDNGNEFIVTGNDAGTLTGKLEDFTNVENLTGGTGADLFTVEPGASLSEAVSGLAGNDTLNVDGDGIVGSFDGGADTDTIDLADVTTAVVDLENTSSTGISGGFSNVETFIGNDTDATLIGTNAVTTWTINGVNDGSLDVPAGTSFFDFTDLQGGSAADTFNVTGIGDITGSINGGEGTDLFNISAAITGSLDGQGDADTLTGTEIDDVTLTGSDGGSGFGFTGLEADIGGGFAGIDSLAGAAVGTLTGENVDSTWTLDGDGLGDRFYDDGNDVLEFSGFSTLQGGSAIDTFDVTDATTLELRGGDGADIFNLGAALTGDIFAEGGLDQINFQGGSVSGDVDGGSSAELNYSAVGGPISVVVQGLGLIDGYQGTATSIGGIFTNITTVVASSGDDTLTGGDTNSTWELGSTATYRGYGSNQTLQFSDFETLQGGSFSDEFNINEDYSANLNGGTGDDTFNLGATLTGIVDGEAGTDTLQGSEVDQVTLTDLGSVDGFQGDEPNLTHFDNIDALFGNGGTLIGLSIPSIWRLDGTPTYEAGGNILEIGGFENLQGGASTDEFLVTADSTFNLFGGSGHDLFDIDATINGSVAGQNGNDTLEGDLIDDVTLFGSSGDGFNGGELNITGNFSGINTITGNGGRILGAPVNSTWLLDGTPTYSDGSQTLNISGFDTLQGNSAVDRFTVTAASPFSLRGGAGNDIFTFVRGRLTNGGTADGEAGNDTLDGTAATGGLTLAGGGGNDTITGSSFGDSLSGGDGNDIVRGVNGDDTLSGGSGTNTLDGGAGTDTVTDLTTDNGTLTNTLFVGIGRNTLISIERAEIFGDPSDNIIDASAFTLGGVTLHGGAGNDTLIGTGLNDSLDGGDGLDTVRLKFTKNPTNPPFITATNTTLSDNNSTDMLQSIEALDLTGHATRATSINAGAFGGFTTLNGGSGNDTLISGQRDSLVKGGAGHDNLTGGAGWDLMYGGAGNDTVSGGVGNDILRGEAGNDSLLGGSGDDRLFGDAGRDVIKGGDGQDSIDGGADNDTILAEGGHDTVTGGAGNDLISGGAGHDTMFGEAGNDTILGDDGDDSISGAAGADVLLGGAGNDKINGGSEKDLVAGQAGDDTLTADTNEINEFFIFDFHKLLI